MSRLKEAANATTNEQHYKPAFSAPPQGDHQQIQDNENDDTGDKGSHKVYNGDNFAHLSLIANANIVTKSPEITLKKRERYVE